MKDIQVIIDFQAIIDTLPPMINTLQTINILPIMIDTPHLMIDMMIDITINTLINIVIINTLISMTNMVVMISTLLLSHIHDLYKLIYLTIFMTNFIKYKH